MNNIQKDSIQNKTKEQKDNDEYSRNFARIPNMLFVSYKQLTKEEKFLYCTLKSVYWDAKPRYVSLRELSEMTGYSTGALSKMIPRLHTCALVHAEIRREKDKYGREYGNAKFNITILDIWELNKRYFSCSPDERDLLDPSLKLVHENRQACSPKDTSSFTKSDKPVHENRRVRAQPKLTKESKKTSLKTIQREREVTSPEEIHSFTPSELLLLQWIEEKNINVAKNEVAVKAQLEKLTPLAKTKPALQSLIETARQLYPNINDLSLGNLVNKRVLNAHAQQGEKNTSNQPPDEQQEALTEDKLDAVVWWSRDDSAFYGRLEDHLQQFERMTVREAKQYNYGVYTPLTPDEIDKIEQAQELVVMEI